MLRTDTAVTIYRQDYTAPAFRIDDVALEIDLVPSAPASSAACA